MDDWWIRDWRLGEGIDDSLIGGFVDSGKTKDQRSEISGQVGQTDGRMRTNYLINELTNHRTEALSEAFRDPGYAVSFVLYAKLL